MLDVRSHPTSLSQVYSLNYIEVVVDDARNRWKVDCRSQTNVERNE
jgi:hypothetical protein